MTDSYSDTRWIGNDEQAALVNIRTGQLIALAGHDGCGKYQPELFVSPIVALIILIRHRHDVWLHRASITRVALWTYQTRSMDDAKGNAMVALGLDPG